MLHARQLDLLASSYADTDGHAVSHNLFSPLKPIVSAQDDSNNNRPPFPQPTAIDNREINSASLEQNEAFSVWDMVRPTEEVSLLFAVEGGSMELLAICALVFYKFKLLLCA
ncbi:uncharacterized protein LOC100840338 [Brachypodium distachyon]|uniref:uncharacterized protein LOC100840338 n=1 Tax=Brachypodium distachyon TaxID=15368 RepID=UPI0005300863|nr:uncharacterized protein LOC100840338 [Brachypodium distachyon]|eukprot:XP_010234763.1 uncharacterized protein LOC100840338 [Brachypodium distachyon]